MALEDLSDAELILLERLLEEEDRDNLLASLECIDDKTSPNYKLLFESVNGQEWGVDENKKKTLLKGVVGVILEGSSRSTKTWSGIFLIMYLCLIRHSKKGCTINIYRETYNEFKTTLYEDFKRILNLFGLPNKFETTTEIHQFRIGKSTINLLGDGKHGGGCDYAFFNEMMMIKQSVFDQVEMRCRIFWWGDYNPSATDHWVFDRILKRKNVAFLRTTFRENPHIAPTELMKILGYEPWLPNSYYIEDNVLMYDGAILDDENQPPPHPTNVDEGTADEFMWKVYGLGLRGAMKGIIFPKVKYIPEFPAHLPPAYGNDFGFVSDPNAFVRYAKEGRDVYLELLLYHPVETPDALDNELTGLGISKYDPITADSSDSRVSERDGVIQMVRDLFYKGWEIRKVSKTKGVTFWLLDMKKYNIHIVENHLVKYAKIEQENYRWKEVNGIQINQPIDGFNHFWDAARYAHMSDDLNNIGATMS